VIPILVDGAKVPKADRLPQDLKELEQRNGLEVRHASFHSDVDKLIRGLKASSEQTAPQSQPEEHGQADEQSRVRREWTYAATGLGVGILSVVLWWFLAAMVVYPLFAQRAEAIITALISGLLAVPIGTVLYNRKRLLEISGWIAYSLLSCFVLFLTLWTMAASGVMFGPQDAMGLGILIAAPMLSVGSVIWLRALRLKRVAHERE
jgi:hypothetical protein